jgi:hypothetical protein
VTESSCVLQSVRQALEGLVMRFSAEVKAMDEAAEIFYVVQCLAYLDDRLR